MRVYRDELRSFPAASVVMNSVRTGKVIVETITVPGYPNCVAVTSMRQSLVHEMEAGGVEVGLGASV